VCWERITQCASPAHLSCFFFGSYLEHSRCHTTHLLSMPPQCHWHLRHRSLHCSLCWHSCFPLLSSPIVMAQGRMKGQHLFTLEICFFFSIYLSFVFYSFLLIYYSTLYFFLLFQLSQVFFPVHILIAFCLFPFMLFLSPLIRLFCLFSSAFSALFCPPRSI
jgi:hypothetical protein